MKRVQIQRVHQEARLQAQRIDLFKIDLMGTIIITMEIRDISLIGLVPANSKSETIAIHDYSAM